MRPAALVLLLVLTGCAYTATPATAQPSETATSSLPTPGPSADFSPVIGTFGPVAWRALPYVPLPDPAGPWCTSQDLHVTGASNDAAATQMFVGVDVVSTSRHTCALQGYPVLTVHDPAGGWVVHSQEPDRFPVQAVVRVAPAGKVTINFRWGASICVEPRTATVDIDLPHRGGRLSATWAPMSAECFDHSPAHRRDVGRVLAEPIGSFTPKGDGTAAAPAVAVLLGQPTVPAGGVLSYEVQVVGGGKASLPTPCPGFRESLVIEDGLTVVASEQHTLNCVGVPPLSRLGTRFRMELAVPRSVQPGRRLLLRWEATIVGTAGAADHPVTVTTSGA